MIEHLIETAHRVVGVVPLKGRREAHGYARGVDHAGDEYVGGGERPYQRIVPHLLRALHPERSEPRAYQIDVNEDVGLDGEEGEDVEPAVVDGTELGVVLEPVAAKAVQYREKTERPEHDQHGREQFILRHFASLHTSPSRGIRRTIYDTALAPQNQDRVARARRLLASSREVFLDPTKTLSERF